MIVISKFYAPYRDIVFKSSDNIKEVIYLYSSDTNRAWSNEVKNNSFRLFDISTNYFELVIIIPFFSVYRRALKHDTIIINYLNFSSIIMLIFCKILNKKIIYFSDIHPENLNSTYNKIKRFLFDYTIINYLPKNLLLKNCFVSPLISSKSLKITTDYFSRKYDFIVVGQFTSRKNYSFLIQLINRLKDKFSFLVVGKGDKKTDKRLRDLNVEVINNVKYDGMFELYNNSKILLAPSKFDVWGLNVQEALLCGCHVIGTNNIGSCVAFKEHPNCNIIDSFELIKWELKISSIINRNPSDISKLKYLKDINESIKAFKNINNID